MSTARSPWFAVAAVAWTLVSSVQAAPVDLNTWTAESYPAVSGFSPGNWNVLGGGSSVQQTVNGQPTLFYSDFNAFYTDVQGKVVVGTNYDDDFIGFALGFQPNDSSNAAADYLLVDWKKADQAYDFGPPSNTPGTTAYAGLAVSRVTGIPTADEFWGHADLAANPSGGLVELARGNTLGSTGWVTGTTYEFRFIFTPTNLKVYVDNVLQLDVNGSFTDGRLAFYNFSQENVTYSAFDRSSVVPEPSSLALGGLGALGLLGYAQRRKATATRRRGAQTPAEA